MKLSLVGEYSIINLIEQGEKFISLVSDSAKLDAQILLGFVLEKEHTYLLTWPEKIISKTLAEHYIQLLTRRHTGEPIAYITGVKEFWSLSLEVSTSTLIPRPDTETLIELVLQLFANENRQLNCLDLGTGTGAIALALASEKPLWHIEAIDRDKNSVELAQKNAKTLKLKHVVVYQSNWFKQIAKNKKFDIIISNPPYIDINDCNLNFGDVRFEPKSALVANDKGLSDIKHIAKEAIMYFSAQGLLFFEHGFQQGKAVRDILTGLGYKSAKTVKDLNGNDRVTWAKVNLPSFTSSNNENT